MKPSKLKDHFQKLHSNYSQEELLVKKARFEKSGTLESHGFVPTKKPILEASYRAAYRIGKSKVAHSLGETLIKPLFLEMVELICGPEQSKKCDSVSLSNSTIQRRILDISEQLERRVIQELKETKYPFSMQLDESTDIASNCQLLVFVRYVHKDSIKEEYLFCEPLLKNSRAADVFKLVDSFF